MKTNKDIKKLMTNLSDTDLGLGIATILTSILNKLPLEIKMSYLKDEIEVAEVSLKELQMRLDKIKNKKDFAKCESNEVKE